MDDVFASLDDRFDEGCLSYSCYKVSETEHKGQEQTARIGTERDTNQNLQQSKSLVLKYPFLDP